MIQAQLQPRRIRRRSLEPGAALAYLRQRESRYKGQVAALLAFGLPLSLVGPLLVTGMLWLRDLGNSAGSQHHAGFWATFAWVCLVVLPVIYLIAAGVQGSVLERGLDADDGFLGTFGRRRATGSLMLLELANVGPRMVLHARRKVRARRAAPHVDYDRAAAAVASLANAGQGIPVSELMAAGEDFDGFEAVLAFLLFHEIADLSSDGRRVWLRSDVLRRLMPER